MLIFIFTNQKDKSFRTSEEGFSLLEILVALFLMTLVFTTVVNTNFTMRQALDEELTNIERAIRFSVNESALRNVIVRVHFEWQEPEEEDELPRQEYAVEYGPSEHFVLPVSKLEVKDSMGIKEREDFEAVHKTINKKFNRIREFADKKHLLNENIRLIGVGSDLSKGLATEFESNIYVYPTGEKDNAIIFLGSEEEVVSLVVDPFTLELKRNYKLLPEGPLEEVEERQFELAKELYEEWLRN